MNNWLRLFLLALPLAIAGCGGASTNSPVDPAKASEEDRRKYKEEERRIDDLERTNRKSSGTK